VEDNIGKGSEGVVWGGGRQNMLGGGRHWKGILRLCLGRRKTEHVRRRKTLKRDLKVLFGEEEDRTC
jgi:hypothetical protein